MTTFPDALEIKSARSDAPLIPEVAERWSPRTFADEPLGEAELRTLLEAARWAPSSYNEQPWHFLVARREDPEEFRRMLECLTEGNRKWAHRAAVLMITVTRTHFRKTGEENPHAVHDVGLAVGQMLAQATAMDIYVHQMAGILPERVRDRYGIPAGFRVVTGIALGRLGPVELDPSDARERRPLKDFVFARRWARPAFAGEGGAGP